MCTALPDCAAAKDARPIHPPPARGTFTVPVPATPTHPPVSASAADVVRLTSEREVGAKNSRHLVAVHASAEAGFEIIHGLLNRVMSVLGVPCGHPVVGGKPCPKMGSYSWEKASEGETAGSPFFDGRHGRVVYTDTVGTSMVVGDFGVIHPDVLSGFDITVPVSALEINLEPFVVDQFG